MRAQRIKRRREIAFRDFKCWFLIYFFVSPPCLCARVSENSRVILFVRSVSLKGTREIPNDRED